MKRDERAMSNEKMNLTPMCFPYGKPRLSHAIMLFSLLFALFSFIGCQNPHSSPEQETALPANSGSFSLIVAGASARTILPDAPDLSDFAVYELAFTAISGGTNLTTDRTNAALANPIVLVAGTYGLTVSAYGDAAKTQLMAEGTKTGIVITAGGNTAAAVTLEPLITGTGSFSWNITIDTAAVTVDAAALTIKDSGGTPVGAAVTLNTTGETTDSRSLAAGIYTVTVLLEDTAAHRSVVWNELMYVYSNLTGNFTFTFTDDYFHNTHWNVTFDYDNGKTYEYGSHPDLDLGSGTQSVANGGAVPARNVVRPGYLFAGWYTDTACTNAWNLASDPVHKDMILYAKWVPNTAGITLSVEEIIDGTAGLTFANPINAITIVRAAGHANEEYTVSVSGTYDSIEWRIAQESADTAETIVTGSSITLSGTNSNYNRPGGHLLELIVELANGIKYLLNIPFTVVEIYYDITFDENYIGSPAAVTHSMPHNSNVTIPAAPARSGFIFDGWNTASDGSGTAYSPGMSINNIADDIALYAQWKIEITIDMFDSGGNGWGGNGALEIYINGTKHSDARVASGSNASYTFFVQPGDLVEFYWKSGSSLTENSFIVYYTDEPPNPAFTSSNNGTWSGANALFYKLRGSLTTADIGQKIGEFEVDRGTSRPKITAQPVSSSYVFGSTAVPLTIAADPVDANPLSYQWYSNTVDSGVGGTLLAGATGTSYTPDISVEGTAYYYCVVTNTGTNETKTSAVASISVHSGEVTIDMFDSYGDGWDGSGAVEIYINGIKHSDARLASGSTGSYIFTVQPGDLVEFYWKSGTNLSENAFIVYYTDEPPSPAFTSSNYSTWSGANALFYKLKGSLTTADVGQKIGEFEVAGGALQPRIITQPVGKFYMFGVDTVAVPLTIAANPADANPLSYQWYSNTTNSTSGGIPITGETNTSYTPNISVEGTAYYYCVVTNTGTGDTRTSAVVSIRVGTGDGSAEAPWPINSAADLQLIGTDDANGWGLNDHYRLTGDVTLTAPWTPVGTSGSSFTGSFDGGGHTISGMEITGASNIGMFGYIGTGGVVKNLGLLNVNVEATSQNVGTVAGTTVGTIENCYASGTVKGSGSRVGGITGYTTGGTVRNCYFNGTVETTSTHGGGIVGSNGSGSILENCYAAGTVTANASTQIGGVTGYQAGTLRNSAALNDVKNNTNGTTSRISGYSSGTNCYARDDLTITIGANAPITRTSTNANSADGADVSTTAPNGGYNVQAFWETTMGWDFTSIWEMGTVTITINGTPTPMALPVLRAP